MMSHILGHQEYVTSFFEWCIRSPSHYWAVLKNRYFRPCLGASKQLALSAVTGRPCVSLSCEQRKPWWWPTNEANDFYVYMNITHLMMELNKKLIKNMPRRHSLQGVFTWGKAIGASVSEPHTSELAHRKKRIWETSTRCKISRTERTSLVKAQGSWQG